MSRPFRLRHSVDSTDTKEGDVTATNLIDLLSRTLSPDLAGALGRTVGALESSVTSAAGA
jgi:hypothetical protein